MCNGSLVAMNHLLSILFQLSVFTGMVAVTRHFYGLFKARMYCLLAIYVIGHVIPLIGHAFYCLLRCFVVNIPCFVANILL